jgi:hypothetical protein
MGVEVPQADRRNLCSRVASFSGEVAHELQPLAAARVAGYRVRGRRPARAVRGDLRSLKTQAEQIPGGPADA